MLFILVSWNLKASPELKWGYLRFEPIFYNENGLLKGTVPERLTKVFAKAGLSYDAIELPNRRIQVFIEQREVDFTVVIPTFLRNKELFLRSDEPLGSIYLQVVSLTEEKGIRSIDDIVGRELILLAGYSDGGNVIRLQNKREFTISTVVENHQSGIKALFAGRGKFFLGYKGPTAIAEKEFKPKQTLFKYQIDEMPMYLFLGKHVLDAQRVMDKINIAHADFINSL